MRKLITLFAMLFVVSSLMAQVTTSSISGSVLDAAGQPIVGATVMAIHTPSGTQYGAVVDGKGYYRIHNIRPGGPYTIKAQMLGFKSVLENVSNIPLGDNYVLKTILAEESQDIDAVVVAATSSSIMHSDRMGVVTNVNSREINTLPSVSRSITDFTRLSPYAGSGNTFAGRDSRYNNINIDGAQFMSRFGTSGIIPGGAAQPISLDAIQEISVNVSPYDIRQSGFTGGSINAITRGGENTFTGSSYVFMRPKSFTGDKVEDRTVANANTDDKKTYGATFSGPIIKDKLFFFVNGEFEKTSKPGMNWRPSNDGIGNSASYISRTKVSDLEAISDYLTTKASGKDWTYDPGQYQDFAATNSENYKILARLDWNINKKHKLMIRYNQVNSTNVNGTNATSGPAVSGATGVGRNSFECLSFSNSWYTANNNVKSITAELNSTFDNNTSNKLLVTYSNIRDFRTLPNDQLFPFVEIYKAGDDGKNMRYTTFGTELFSYGNDMTNKNLSVTDNFNFAVGNHSFTAGLSWEYQSYANSYLREGTSFYAYNYDDVFNNGVFSLNTAAPIAFAYQVGFDGGVPTPSVAFSTVSAYLQDEWQVNQRFKLTAGVRFEVPFYHTNLEGSPEIRMSGQTVDQNLKDISFYNGKKVDLSSWPKSSVIASPRVGFNWDVNGDRSIQVRGGTGIFSGFIPFVWFTNQPQSSGFVQTPEIKYSRPGDIPAGLRQFNPDFINHILHNPNFDAPKKGFLPNGAAIAGVDADFKMPLVWRSSVATDIKLPWGLIGTMEAMYTRDLRNVVQQNIHLEIDETKTLAGPDNRQWMKRMHSNINSFTLLTNGKEKGYSASFTAQLTKTFSNGFSGMVSYTYNHVKDLGANPGSTANSAFTASANVGDSNNPLLGYSNFSMPHRVNGYLSYSITWFRHATSTFALYYNGTNMGRLSYVFSSPLEGSGINTTQSLIYIPKDKSEMRFVDKGSYTADQQAADFEEYINGNSYLKSRKGKYVERFGGLQPWLNRFDFKFTQDLFTNFGTSRRYTLQFTWDVMNLGNLLNKKWGVYKTNAAGGSSFFNYQDYKLLSSKGLNADNEITYTLNADNSEDFKKRTTWIGNATTSSTWGMQMGLRLKF